MSDWQLFHGNGKQETGVSEKLEKLKPPPWRQFSQEEDIKGIVAEIEQRREKVKELAKTRERDKRRGENFRLIPESQNGNIPKLVSDVINAVNAAIYLRRPLLVTGKPGSGKTSLAYAIAYELDLAPVLCWSITARSTLQEGLYRYDAIARLQDAQLTSTQQSEEQEIGKYITLGSLGTAFLPSYLPRVLLIDEIDKSDINFPNDLLNILEEGEFAIPELVRRSQSGKENKFQVGTQDQDIKAEIENGRIRCYAFPIIVMTSNGERDFPPAFKRRCLRVRMPYPSREALKAIVEAHFNDTSFDRQAKSKIENLIGEFMKKDNNQSQERATDQLLNTIYLLTCEVSPPETDEESLKEILFRSLTSSD